MLGRFRFPSRLILLLVAAAISGAFAGNPGENRNSDELSFGVAKAGGELILMLPESGGKSALELKWTKPRLLPAISGPSTRHSHFVTAAGWGGQTRERAIDGITSRFIRTVELRI